MQRIFSSLVLASCLLLWLTPAAHGFMWLELDGKQPETILINKVHAPHWDIAYKYADDCPPEQRDNDEALTAAATEALQMWLQPLRNYAKRPIVDDFRYQLNDDMGAGDFNIIFDCEIGVSFAFIPFDPPSVPAIVIQQGTEVTPNFMIDLVHEIGHIFGLADSYLGEGDPALDTGGFDWTKGAQPVSIMAVMPRWSRDRGLLSKDDKNGIVWLYKVTYEGLGLRDCFFPDYELEADLVRELLVDQFGCRPKYPLIFALKHDIEHSAASILSEDENLDVKVQDADGMTALHYAVLNGYTRVVKALLARDDIDITDVNNRNRAGRTVLQEAIERGHNDIVKLLLEYHPLAVDPKRSLTITWGALKTIE